jgi:phenylpropionate dioxygenase-like ring-hydroxylating dioxygenase large terminal subunit
MKTQGTSDARRLAASPALRRGLRNYWYPVLRSADVGADAPVGVTRLGEAIVVWRSGDGVARVFADRCPHRGAPLSIGDVVGGRLQCRYHGLQYDGTGQCRLVPIEQQDDGRQAKRLCASAYPSEERAGLIWAYLGDVDRFPPPPLRMQPEMDDPEFAWVVWESTWNANWLLIHDNTCDPYHVPFLHGHFVTRVENGGLSVEMLPDGNPLITTEAFGALVTEPLEADVTESTVLVRRKGATDDHSATFDEVRFELPCLASVWVPVPDGGPVVRLHQFELPIDEDKTVVYAWAGRAVSPDLHEETRQALEEFFIPVTSSVFADDSWITEVQPDVEDAWQGEHLLSVDVGPVRVRKCIFDAYERQRQEFGDVATSNGDQAEGSMPEADPRTSQVT